MNTKPANSKLIQLVKLLRDGDYHDGNSLGETLDITRSAIWKMVKKLEGYGIKIDAIMGRGYIMSEPLYLLEPDVIKQAFAQRVELTVLESTPSTNNYFKLSPKTPAIKCCIAEHQTQGRGRLNRTWHSPFGKNLYLSCYHPLKKDLSELSGLSLVISLSIVSALRELGLTDSVFVKWPNDVLSNGKKIAGILIDVEAESHGGCDVTIGIGLNVNMFHNDELQSKSIDQAWTSMAEECGVAFDRSQVAVVLLQKLLDYIARFEEEGFGVFIDEWRSVDSLANKSIALNCINQIIEGSAAGIDQKGHLLLQLDDGTIRAFSSGDARLLKN